MNRGAASLLVIGIIALLGVGGWGLSKTRWFHGESKRAKTSTDTTNTLISAQNSQGGSAAAYVQTMGDVVSTLPESREKQFLGRAGQIALSYLPQADPQKLLEAERLKVAFLTGQLELAQTLTQNALQDSGKAKQELTRAIAAKRASDLALEQAAAEARGAEQAQFWMMCIAIAAVILWLWVKITHPSPLAISRAVQDMRTGSGETNPSIAALDGALTPFQQANVALMYWLRTKITKASS